MKKSLIPLLAFLATGACNKSSPSSTSRPGSIVQTGGLNYPRTLTMVIYDTISGNRTDSQITNIGYDAQNRITTNIGNEYSLPATQLIEVDTVLRTYTSDTIKTMEREWKNGSFFLSSFMAYRLDPVTHLAINALTTNTLGNPLSVSSDSQTFQYDANGYLLVNNRFEPNYSTGHLELSLVQSYTISNGNIVVEADYIGIPLGGDTSSTSIKEYETFTYSGQLNPVMNTTGNGNNWNGFGSTSLLGHANTNEWIIVTLTNIHNVTDYSYTSDSQGRTSVVTLTTGSGKLREVVRYIYY